MNREKISYDRAIQMVNHVFPYVYPDKEALDLLVKYHDPQEIYSRHISIDMYMALYVIASARKNTNKKNEPTQKVLDRRFGRKVRKKRTGSRK